MLFMIAIVIAIFTILFLLYKRSTRLADSKARYVSVKMPATQQAIPVNRPKQSAFIHQDAPEQLKNFSLIEFSQLTETGENNLRQLVSSYRKPHPLLISLTQNSFEPNELFDLIKTDPEMTAKVLQTVNSSMFALRQPITSVNHAVIFLGVSTVKNIALQHATAPNVEAQSVNQKQALEILWQTSYLASSLVFLFVKELNNDNAAELSTHCLLSYLGDMAVVTFDQTSPEIYLQNKEFFKRVDALQQHLALNSNVVASQLIKDWDLPDSIQNGVNNLTLPLVNSASFKMKNSEQQLEVLLCYLACRCAERLTADKSLSFTQLMEQCFSANNEDFYYFNQLVADNNFTWLANKFKTPIFINKVNKLMV